MCMPISSELFQCLVSIDVTSTCSSWHTYRMCMPISSELFQCLLSTVCLMYPGVRVLQCVAVCWSVLQCPMWTACITYLCDMLDQHIWHQHMWLWHRHTVRDTFSHVQYIFKIYWVSHVTCVDGSYHTDMLGMLLQGDAATHFNTLQHTATHCVCCSVSWEQHA